MAKYVIGQEVVEAETAEALIKSMHESSQTPTDNDGDWMAQTAARIKLQIGMHVRTDTAENFVEDLITAGLITRG